MKRVLLILATIVLLPLNSYAAAEIIVGVAANYMLPMQELASMYEKRTGVKVQATFTSSGALYGQIVNGAPYDLFLSADEMRPAKLESEGWAEKPFVYAKGLVVVWTLQKELCGSKDWKEIVVAPSVKRISIANMETAPYGAASKVAMTKAELWDRLQDKIVIAQNIAQSFQYAQTESADIGFIAFSSVFSDLGKKGCYVPVPEAPEIVQAGCVLKKAKNKGEAEAFVRFLDSPEARKVKEQYGYK